MVANLNRPNNIRVRIIGNTLLGSQVDLSGLVEAIIFASKMYKIIGTYIYVRA